MIRCEHCGSVLPDGAIFCGECGRSVTVSANRRPAPVAPQDDTPPPPLQQPDQHGRHPDPAAEAWLPEATLDPATRAWLVGEDRQRSSGVPTDRPAAPAPLQAPDHVNAAANEPRDWSGVGRPEAVPADGPWHADQPHAVVEPSLDPDAQPTTGAQPTNGGRATADAADDRGADTDLPEHTRTVPRRGDAPSDAPRDAVPAWAPPAPQPTAAPSRPSWWVGRGAAAAEPPVADEPRDGEDTADQQDRAGDTAVVEPLVDRRPTPTPLIAPGSGPATCPVCGNTYEPDDIFCAECGAVRPTVTAAFTGPVVPLPTARPDWAADESTPAGALLDQTGQADTSGRDEPDERGAHDGGEHAERDEHVERDERGERAERDDRGEHGAPDEHATDAKATDVDASDGNRADEHAADEHAADEDVASEHVAGDTVDSGPEPGARPTAEPARARHVHDGAADLDDVVPEETPRTPVRSRRARVDPETPSAVTPVPATPAPASLTIPSSAPVPTSVDAPGVPTAAPLPPLPRTSGPVLPPVASAQAPSSGEDDLEDEDVEETRIVAKTTSDAPFVLHFSTGERAAVHGTGLLGRLPRPQPGERFDDLLTLHDPGKSVSKTHLELGRDGDDLWVSDRFSGNGTVVRHIDGSIRRCEPGRRYRVERGARVDIGEQFFLVQ